jgi:hypothetical protein
MVGHAREIGLVGTEKRRQKTLFTHHSSQPFKTAAGAHLVSSECARRMLLTLIPVLYSAVCVVCNELSFVFGIRSFFCVVRS